MLLRQCFIAGKIPPESVVEMLWNYHSSASIPDDERLAAANLSAFLEDAEHGYYGTLEGVREEVDKFSRSIRRASNPNELASMPDCWSASGLPTATSWSDRETTNLCRGRRHDSLDFARRRGLDHALCGHLLRFLLWSLFSTDAQAIVAVM